MHYGVVESGYSVWRSNNPAEWAQGTQSRGWQWSSAEVRLDGATLDRTSPHDSLPVTFK